MATKIGLYERKIKKLSLCSGCSENFYNGNNPYGIRECWRLKSARIVKAKFVPMSMVPPWTGLQIVKTLSCHRRIQPPHYGDVDTSERGG
jgi:hypothetical protein